jgi:transposase-like protein
MEPRASSGPEAGQRPELPYIENGNRREYATWFKFQVIDECKRPGASVSIVARQHNINTNVVFRWRREIQLGLLKPVRPPQSSLFATVGVIGEDGKLEPAPPAPAAPTITLPSPAEAKPSSAKTLSVPSPPQRPSVGVIEMQLPGRIKIRIEGDVNKDTLRRVLAVAREFA